MKRVIISGPIGASRALLSRREWGLWLKSLGDSAFKPPYGRVTTPRDVFSSPIGPKTVKSRSVTERCKSSTQIRPDVGLKPTLAKRRPGAVFKWVDFEQKTSDSLLTIRDHPDGLKPVLLTSLGPFGFQWTSLVSWSMKEGGDNFDHHGLTPWSTTRFLMSHWNRAQDQILGWIVLSRPW